MNYKRILLMSMAMFLHTSYSEANGSIRTSRSAVQDALCEILSRIDEIQCSEDLCKATVITGAQILSESGTYCLGNDVTGTIFITGSSITLNLNGYTVFAGSDGIAVSDTASDVVIKNGFLKGSGSDNGIFLNGATNVRIENVTCESWENGMYILDTASVKIEDVICTTCSAGINIQGGSTITLDHVMSSNNDSYGLTCEAVKGLLVRDSSFDYNIEVAARVGSDTSAEFIQCSANSDRIGLGFQVNFVSRVQVLLRDCRAVGLATGFDFGTCDDVCIDAYNCVAQKNDVNGFAIAATHAYLVNCIASSNNTGFLVRPECGAATLRDCCANNNGAGFSDTSVSTDGTINMYLNCVACGNFPNYSANIIAANNAPVRSAADARGFDNVDCDMQPV